jgi:glutamate-1-semialdehyde 2,1-aminomutase
MKSIGRILEMKNTKVKFQNSTSNLSYSQRLNNVIPGGAHTYSRGDDQFPENAPQILISGKGSQVTDADNKTYLDYGMALRSVTLGYANEAVNNAAIEAISLGNNLTRASMIELQAAEKLVSTVKSLDMVKFTKNGSTATSAAIKLARAYNNRTLIARCRQQPFFSYDDWFIGSTTIKRGIPKSTIQDTKLFDYNDIESLKNLVELYPDQLACVILEPAATECPSLNGEIKLCCGKSKCDRYQANTDENFLQKVQNVCKANGIVFILDETITGFRWSIKGAQHIYNVKPDLTTFGKAMSNGFSVAAVGGKKEIMELGSIKNPGQERTFLLSTTHGAEMCGLAAFLATLKEIEEKNVIDKLWSYGQKFMDGFNKEIAFAGLEDYFKIIGPTVSPSFITTDIYGVTDFNLRTLFSQEMISNGVLMPWVSFSSSHSENDLDKTFDAIKKSLSICSMGIEKGIDKYLRGPTIKPVFRKYN